MNDRGTATVAYAGVRPVDMRVPDVRLLVPGEVPWDI